MRELNIERRLMRIEENIEIVKHMLEKILNKPEARPSVEEVNDIMSVKQVAQYLGLECNVIYAKCAQGDIPYFKIGKGYRLKKKIFKTGYKGKWRSRKFRLMILWIITCRRMYSKVKESINLDDGTSKAVALSAFTRS
jgi:excisionase family DNA binding protein